MKEEDMEDDEYVIVARDSISKTNMHPNRMVEAEDGSNNDVKHQDDSGEYLSDIGNFIEGIHSPLWALNKFIHENPELAFQEQKAHNALTKFMWSQKGWHVTPSAYGMETAWVAEYDSGKPGPVVSFNAEMGLYTPCSICRDLVTEIL